jgi:hypothetical protein
MDYTLIQVLADTTKVHIAQLSRSIATEVATFISTSYPDIAFILAPNADASEPVTYLNGEVQS